MTFPQGSCGVASSPQGYGWLANPQGQCSLVPNAENGGIIKIYDVTNESSIDITGVFGDSLNLYELEFQCLTPATDGTHLRLKYSTDGGATWEGGTNYMWASQTGAYDEVAVVNSQNNADNSTVIVGQSATVRMGNAAGEIVSGYVVLCNLPSTTLRKQIFGRMAWRDAGGANVNAVIGGMFNTTTAINGVQITVNSGNVSGKVKVKGKKN